MFVKDLTIATQVVYYRDTPFGEYTMTDYRLDSALDNPEQDVQVPSTRRPTSMISLIAALKVGETLTRTMEISGDVTLQDIQQNLATWKRGLSSSVGSSVKHAKKRIGNDQVQFSVETTHTLTSAGRLYIIAIVARNPNE